MGGGCGGTSREREKGSMRGRRPSWMFVCGRMGGEARGGEEEEEEGGTDIKRRDGKGRLNLVTSKFDVTEGRQNENDREIKKMELDGGGHRAGLF